MEILAGTPQAPEEVDDPRWRDGFLCKTVVQADSRKRELPNRAGEIDRALTYFLRRLPGSGDRTRSSVEMTFTALATPLLCEPVNSLFFADTTFTPADAWEKGKIIVIALPCLGTAEGPLANALFKFVSQKTAEVRNLDRFPRPCFYFMDEYHAYMHAVSDREFFSTARSMKLVSIAITQSVMNIYAAAGGDAFRAEADGVLGLFGIRIAHMNVCPRTNAWMSDMIGKDTRFLRSSGASVGPDGKPQANFGHQESSEHIVRPIEYTRLVPGGPPHFFSDAIVHAARTWKASHTTALRVRFPQKI